MTGEFLAVSSEILTYRISLHGIPVGRAELSATSEQGKLRIRATVASLPVIAAVYPVDDQFVSEVIAGNYIVTTIRQHEGRYLRNAGYTLMLREKKGFATDRLSQGLVTEPLPRDDVLDAMTGFYFLRTRPMKEGDSLLLHLFDSGKYAATRVDVLRREQLEVCGLGSVSTLVLRPKLTRAALFRRSGDILIWLTDDIFHVPVGARTTIALGDVTADLVSSEIQE